MRNSSTELNATLLLILSIASVVVPLVLTFITYRYMKLTEHIADEATSTRQGAIYLEADKLLSEVRPDRHKLRHFPKDVADWTEEQRKLANEVSAVYQRVAYLWSLGLLEESLFAKGWGRTFIDTWETLEPWVLEYRIETKAVNQRIDLELLVKKLKRDPEVMDALGLPREEGDQRRDRSKLFGLHRAWRDWIRKE
jgi:predicted nuclease with TOPRIM domain